MRIELIKKRIKRNWAKAVDPLYFEERYGEQTILTVEESDYYEKRLLALENKVFALFVNIDDEADRFFQKKLIDDCVEIFGNIEDEELDMIVCALLNDRERVVMEYDESDLKWVESLRDFCEGGTENDK